MRNHLHRAAKIIAAPFLVDDALVNLAGGEVVRFFHLHRDEALVMAEIEIGFCAVIGDEYFTVLERRHRAGIDVDVRIELHHRDFDAARFKNRGERCGGDPFA